MRLPSPKRRAFSKLPIAGDIPPDRVSSRGRAASVGLPCSIRTTAEPHLALTAASYPRPMRTRLALAAALALVAAGSAGAAALDRGYTAPAPVSGLDETAAAVATGVG